jgi:DNA-binding beta-propeller fold protein YncE
MTHRSLAPHRSGSGTTRSHALARTLLFAGLAAVSAGSLADVGAAKTIAAGLANPRGIDFAPNGALYVAEAGRGGTGACTPSPPNPAAERCYGETGAITEILPGVGFRRIAAGLPSLVLASGTAEGGPANLAFHGMNAFVNVAWGGDPALRAGLGPKSSLFGTMLQVTPAGKYRVVADVAAHEAAYNPGGGAIDSNPYGLVALPGRRIVADAGANVLVEVLANGRTRTFAVLPPLPPVQPLPFPRESVPTSVVEGPDGALYVGQLTAFPFWPGTSSILRVSSDGQTIETYASGFTAVVDLAFDAGGALYVLEVARGQIGPFPPPPPNPGIGIGRLMRMCPGGAPTELLAGLDYPSGVAIGPDGAAYLTNKGTSSDSGEVLRLAVTPCP